MLLSILACVTEGVVERGEVEICLGGPDGQATDVALDFQVTVGGEGEVAGCEGRLMTDAEGAEWALGLRVTGAEGEDLGPAIEWGEVGALSFRDRMVWGDVAGVQLLDWEGALLLAADEGWWGGAFEAGELEGFSARRGDELVATEPTECEPIEGYTLEFSADEQLSLTPVEEGLLHVGGRAFTAMAVAAWDYGEGAGCSVSDNSGATAWVMVR